MSELLNKPGATTLSDAASGLVTVPLILNNGLVQEESVVAAGMVGYKIHSNTNDDPTKIAVEPVHGWSLLLKSDSHFRQDLIEWEIENVRK